MNRQEELLLFINKLYISHLDILVFNLMSNKLLCDKICFLDLDNLIPHWKSFMNNKAISFLSYSFNLFLLPLLSLCPIIEIFIWFNMILILVYLFEWKLIFKLLYPSFGKSKTLLLFMKLSSSFKSFE